MAGKIANTCNEGLGNMYSASAGPMLLRTIVSHTPDRARYGLVDSHGDGAAGTPDRGRCGHSAIGRFPLASRVNIRIGV
jgi:hypothetical protein